MIRVQRVGTTVEVEADSGTAAYSVVHFAADEWAEFVQRIEAAATARAERAEAAEADLRRQLADAKSAFFAAIDQRDGLRSLLRDVGNHLSTEHEVRHLHDHLGENLGCAGCALLENVRAALFGPTDTEGADRG